jgi:hypothetical protein
LIFVGGFTVTFGKALMLHRTDMLLVRLSQLGSFALLIASISKTDFCCSKSVCLAIGYFYWIKHSTLPETVFADQ